MKHQTLMSIYWHNPEKPLGHLSRRGGDEVSDGHDLSEALRSIESTLSKCEKALLKRRERTPQYTLTTRRIEAFKIAVELIKEKMP